MVDDDERLGRTMAKLLDRAQIEATAVFTGHDALERLRAQEFDVLVSDIRMPDIDGVGLMRAVREHNLELPVVLMTGDPSIETAQLAVELGAFRYLTKPIATDEMVAIVRRAAFAHRMALLKRKALAMGGDEALPSDPLGLSLALDRTLAQMTMHYQPIVDGDGALFGYEALMRPKDAVLRHPGLVLEAAERLGRIHELSRRVREMVTEVIDTAPPDAIFFVNLHPIDLLDRNLVDPKAPMSRRASRIVLEFTERLSLDVTPEVQRVAGSLRKLGYSLAVDDLGAGYAGLTSFAALEPEIVKVDMSLTRSIDTTPLKQKLVASVVDLCRGLDVKVVAEGIETKAERDTCREIGCQLLQGYSIARPGVPFPAITWE